MGKHERNLERMKLAARRMDAREEEFLAERAERIEKVIAGAEVESTVPLRDFVARIRGFEVDCKNSD